MDGRPNRGIKAAFSNSSGVLCTGPEMRILFFGNTKGLPCKHCFVPLKFARICKKKKQRNRVLSNETLEPSGLPQSRKSSTQNVRFTNKSIFLVYNITLINNLRACHE